LAAASNPGRNGIYPDERHLSKQQMVKEDQVEDSTDGTCPFAEGIENGLPVIGLGLFLILFALVPLIAVPRIMPLPVTIFLGGSGIFMIWAGLYR